MFPHRLMTTAACLIVAWLCGACSAQGGSGARTVAVTMRELAFEPGTIPMHVSERMHLTFKNEGPTTHDFSMPSMPMRDMKAAGGSAMHQMDNHEHLDMHMAFDPGARGELTFIPTKAGQYAFYCTVPGHREAGMHGTIDVQ